MKQACRCVAAVLAVACAAGSLPAGDTRIIAGQRSQQQRAQRLLREMLTQVIDTRLRQLEENAMTAMPLYKDLSAMRRRGDDLVQKEMADAVDLLNRAASAGAAGRTAAFKAAQTKMHQILLRLLAERERLRLQRKRAELIDQLRVVIARQKAVRRATTSLAGAAEQAVLVSIRSQKDVRLLCGRLQQVLKDASTQPGELGAIATEADRALQATGVAEAMDLATKHLTTAAFVQAANQQQDAIKGLQRAMGVLRKVSRDALLKARDLVLVLLADQERLREQVRTKTMTEANIEKWLAAQIKITDRIGGLAKFLGGNQRCAWVVDVAEAGANAARQAVFAADQRRAVDRQGKVIGALAQVLVDLKLQIAAAGDLTAKEYRDLHQKLSATERILEAVVAMHQQAVADPKKAAAVEKDVKGMLEPFLGQTWLPVTVASRLRTATERVDAAAIALKKSPAGSAIAVRQADRAIRHALGEASEAAARFLRRSLATEVGELNRAAEALARAEAVSSYIASRIDDDEVSAAAVGRAIEEIQKIRLLACKVAEGVKDTATEAVAPLDDLVKMPEPTTRPATPRKQIARHTAQAAAKLEKAARGVRAKMQVAAGQLREAVGEEISEVELILTDLNGLVGGLSQPSVREVNDFADEAMISTPAIGATLLRAASAMKKPAAKKPPATTPATGPGEKPEKIDPQRELQRSRIVAEMKLADLKRELGDVEELIRLAEMQQDAVLDVAGIAGMLEEEFIREGDLGDEGMVADLEGAMQEFAGAMTGAGMLAQAISGSGEMANAPLTEATRIASELGMEFGEGEDPGGLELEGGELAGEGEMPGAGTPMGEGMVPASALGTVEMMVAGVASGAFGAMSMSIGTGTGTGRGMGAGMGALGLGAAGPGGLGGGGSSGDGPAFANMERLFGLAIYLPSETGGDSRVNTKRPGDTRLGPGVYDEGHAWFVSLPESVQEAVKSRGKRTTPTGYEELLKRYFQDYR